MFVVQRDSHFPVSESVRDDAAFVALGPATVQGPTPYPYLYLGFGYLGTDVICNLQSCSLLRYGNGRWRRVWNLHLGAKPHFKAHAVNIAYLGQACLSITKAGGPNKARNPFSTPRLLWDLGWQFVRPHSALRHALNGAHFGPRTISPRGKRERARTHSTHSTHSTHVCARGPWALCRRDETRRDDEDPQRSQIQILILNLVCVPVSKACSGSRSPLGPCPLPSPIPDQALIGLAPSNDDARILCRASEVRSPHPMRR